VNALERSVRRLPPPVYTTLKELRHRVDPMAVAHYQRRSGYVRPLPPSRLRARTGRGSNPRVFVESARRTAAGILETLERAGRPLTGFTSVLDYGCGSGSVLPHVMELSGATGVRWAGSDVDAEAIGWARAHLPGVDWAVNPYRGPLRFGDDAFDLIYSISILTHLDEPLQDAWLAELARVLRPGGTALLSVHGPHAYGECVSGRVISRTASCATRIAARGDLAVEGFIYEPYDRDRWSVRDFAGIDDTFGMTFHHPDWIRRSWSRWFDVVDIVPRAIDGWQDAVILHGR
jgi:SAM-dependent methyltransferase